MSSPKISVPRPSLCVEAPHAYDRVIGAMTRSPLPVVVATCAGRWPQDFLRAARSVDPVSMIILTNIEVNLFLLADPNFDPAMKLADELGSYEFERVVERQPGVHDIDLPGTLVELSLSIQSLDTNAVKALWAGLAFAKWPYHEEDECRLNRWLNVAHLRRFLC